METNKLLDCVTEIALNNPRYPRESLLFVVNGIHWAFEQIGERRHLTGEELTELLILYARSEFGQLADTVFREWGIYQTAHLGEIVYRLISAGLLTKQDDDSLDDFKNVLDLEVALNDPDFYPGILS